MIIYIILFFLLGCILSDIFINIGYRLPIKENVFVNRKCIKCKSEFTLVDKIPIIGYIKNKGKCPKCNEKLYKHYFLFMIFTGLIYALCFYLLHDKEPNIIYLFYSLVFVSTLLIVIVSDFKYMLILNEVLISSSVLLILLKLYIDYYNEEIVNFMDFGYNIIFMFINFILIYIFMSIIKKIGDYIFKNESMGSGDVKLMSVIAIILGYKMSIVVIFIGAFIALPFSVYNMIKNNNNMFPFGPFLSISSIILFLFSIDFDIILNFIN
jgi:prepilin signal peptidase PulO-like enzyme (type II secretory pathway)